MFKSDNSNVPVEVAPENCWHKRPTGNRANKSPPQSTRVTMAAEE